MAEKKKEEMTEEYKKALAEKEAKAAAEQKEATLREMKQKKSVAKARREAEKLKEKLEQERFDKRIAEYDAEIKKAEKKLENQATYDMIGKVTLLAALIFLIMTIGMKLAGAISIESFIALMLISFIILSISVYFQSITMFAETTVRKTNLKKRDLGQALISRKNRHR